MTAKRDVIEPRRRVPGQEEIAFHIAVVGEDVTEPVEIEVVRVAEAVRNDFRIPAIRRQTQQASRFRLANRRVRQRDVLLTEAGVVAADEIPPAVRPFAHRVTAMLGEMEREKFLRRTVRFAIAIAIVITRKPAVTGEVEIVPVKAHSHPAGFRLGEQSRLVRSAVAVGVLKNPDPAWTGDHDAPARIERHRVDVIGQIRIRVKRDAKPRGDAQAEFLHRDQFRCLGRERKQKTSDEGKSL